MIYAIIKTGGKQIKLSVGDMIWTEKLLGDEESTVIFDEVVAIGTDKGLEIGTPLIPNALVKATIKKHGKGPKLTIFRTKAKSNWSRKQGHRQPYTKLLINEIILDKKVLAKFATDNFKTKATQLKVTDETTITTVAPVKTPKVKTTKPKVTKD